MPDQTAVPTYDELMEKSIRLEEKYVRLLSEAERTEDRLARERDRANVILAHIVEGLDAAEDTAWEHLPDSVRELRARVTELEAWRDRAVQQGRRAGDDLDRWNRLWAASGGESVELADMIDAILDQRDAARALVDRVRLALSNHPRCDVHPDDDVISCGWKRAVASVQWALDQTDGVTDHG